MICNSYVKFSLIVFLTFVFPSCGNKRESSSSDSPMDGESKIERSKDVPSTGQSMEEEVGREELSPENSSSGTTEIKNPEEEIPSFETVKVEALGSPQGVKIETDDTKKDPKEEASPPGENEETYIPFDMVEHFSIEQFKDSGLFGESKDEDEDEDEDERLDMSVAYIYHNLVYIDNELRKGDVDKEVLKYYKPFCGDQNDCSKGIDLKKLTRSHIAHLIKIVGAFYNPTASEMFVMDEDKVDQIKRTFPVVMIQGPRRTLAVEEWIEFMERKNVKRIMINLTHFGVLEDQESFFILGEFIKKQEIDLYIEGRCSFLCFNYLLPAARRVYIGSYGYISSEGNLKGLHLDIEKTFNLSVETMREGFINSFSSDMDLLKDSFKNSFQNQGVMEKEKVEEFLTSLKNWEEGTGKEIKEKLDDFLYNKGYDAEKSLPSLTETETEEMLKSLSPNQQESLKLFFVERHTSEVVNFTSNILLKTEMKAQKESAYYEERTTIAKDLEVESSPLGYSFFDFLNLSSFLSRNDSYTKYSEVPRAYYNISEEEKPYEVVPSADLLRALGLDVRGENNTAMSELYWDKLLSTYVEKLTVPEKYLNEGKVLYLDKKRIENCDFFAPDATYTKGTLKDCLAQE